MSEDSALPQPRTLTTLVYGQPRSSHLDPAQHATPLLAATLADVWLDVGREVPGVTADILAATNHFLRHLATQAHAADSFDSFDITDLRRRHLDAWEHRLLEEAATARSDRPYSRAVSLFALLRRLDADQPGLLDPGVSVRLQQPTRLRHRRFAPTEAFSPAEVRRLRSAAHRTVHRHRASHATEPTVEVIAALHVLLSLATGEPPEVLRRLTVDRVTATAGPTHDGALMTLTPSARLAWLARRDAVEVFAVTYYKARAHETKTELYSRRDRAAHRALTALIEVTASPREESGSESMWLLRRPSGVKQPSWSEPSLSLRAFAHAHDLDIAEPVVFTRLRKVVIASEAIAAPDRFFGRGRQSPETFFRHYTNSPVLRAHAGGLLLEGIEGAFDAAVAGPMVVTPDAERALAAGATVEGLDAETSRALAAGELDGPHVACADPTDSPFASPGQVCGRSMTGSCFGCSNALITERHLPAVLAIADVADPSRAADPQTWQQHWKPLHETITRVILPAFSSEAIDAARSATAAVPVDLGIRNDLRGAGHGHD